MLDKLYDPIFILIKDGEKQMKKCELVYVKKNYSGSFKINYHGDKILKKKITSGGRIDWIEFKTIKEIENEMKNKDEANVNGKNK